MTPANEPPSQMASPGNTNQTYAAFPANRPSTRAPSQGRTIYFDNASTTPVCDAAIQVMQHGLADEYGNPSSAHAMGLFMERRIQEANRTLANLLHCSPEEIIHTSGATEANNLALLGALSRYRRGDVITTAMEHPSVGQPLKHRGEQGIRVISVLPSDIPRLVSPNTLLVSFAQVNNETGDINDVDSIAKQVKRINPETLVHVDGAQGFCKLPVSLSHVDLYSWSAHKIHGLKGAGGLMVRRGVRLAPLLFGGGQQKGLRPGTENISGILAMTAAAQAYHQSQAAHLEKVSALYASMLELTAQLPDTFVNRYSETASPYILNISFMGVHGETLVHALSQQGIYISAGAACRSKKNDRSPLHAFIKNEASVKSAVRFSFSHQNTAAEAAWVKSAVVECVTTLRSQHKR